MDAAFGTIRGRRLLQILAVTLSLAVSMGLGYSLSRSRAASVPSDQEYYQKVKDMGTPQGDAALITVDQAQNLICVKLQHEKGMGASCTSADSPMPMTLISGGTPSDPAHIVVVDPQRRLGTVHAVLDGRQFAANSQDGGLSIQMQLAHPADDLTILDRQGEVIDVSHPSATSNRAIQAGKSLSEPGD
jgi:hypothetical protein